MRAAAVLLALAGCTANPRSVQHALLDVGLDEVRVLGWAPSCAPDNGSYFEALGARGETVTGVVCCGRGRYSCEVSVTARGAPTTPAGVEGSAPTPP